MRLSLEHFTDTASYRRAVDGYLRANLQDCNQLFAIVQGLTEEAISQRKSWLACLRRDGVTCGVALIHSSPPLRSIILSDLDVDGARLVAVALENAGIGLTDATGPRHSVNALVAALRPLPSTRLRSLFGNHVLDKTPAALASAGDYRSAHGDDLGMLVAWERAFMIECGFPVTEALLEATVLQRLANPATLYRLWEVDRRPVAMAVGKLVPPTARIGPVYTAMECRTRGHAGALVAHFCSELMAAGAGQVSLFTDLANPVSNGVYRRIGFRLIGELVQVDLEARS